MDEPHEPLVRRRFLRTLAAVSAGSLLAGCSGGGGGGDGGSGGNGGDGGDSGDSGDDDGTATPSPTPTEDGGGGDSDGDDGRDDDSDGGDGDDGSGASSNFGGWLDDVANYDGVVDRTGQGEVTVTVGAEGNGGNFAFSPAAVRVSAGTTVVWEWNGKGGSHNVVAEEGADFESELTAEEGFTFERTFDSAGVVKYYCTPHRSLGMKGVVVVE